MYGDGMMSVKKLCTGVLALRGCYAAYAGSCSPPCTEQQRHLHRGRSLKSWWVHRIWNDQTRHWQC